MRVSIWGYGFLFLISVGLLLINIFGNMTKDNEPNYYLIKEITEKALIDAVDVTAYRVGIGYDGITQENDSQSMHCITGKPGQIRIIKEKFIESFIRRYSEKFEKNGQTHTISFEDIDECPPKVTIKITNREKRGWFSNIFKKNEDETEYETKTDEIVNILSAILESEN